MKRKVLLVNNYDMAASRKAYLEGKSSSHHQFGTNELIDSNLFDVDYILIAPHKSNNRLFKVVSLFFKWLMLYRCAKKYDIVYGAADFTVDFLGIMKKLHLFKPKLVSIFHHPPFSYRLKLQRIDAIIFLGMAATTEMKEAFPHYRDQIFFLQWGPDFKFYKSIAPQQNCFQVKQEVVFISNGKTHRHHEVLVSAARAIEVKTIIVCDHLNKPANYSPEDTFVELVNQNAPDDVKMIKLLNQCSVLVIPTFPSTGKLGPIGLTSFVDAIALGMPLIVSDNTVFAEIVENHRLGLVYKAGDEHDLQQVMQVYKSRPDLVIEYGKNALAFGEANDMNQFGDRLFAIINGFYC